MNICHNRLILLKIKAIYTPNLLGKRWVVEFIKMLSHRAQHIEVTEDFSDEPFCLAQRIAMEFICRSTLFVSMRHLRLRPTNKMLYYTNALVRRLNTPRPV